MLAYTPVGLGDAEDILDPALSPRLQTLQAARALSLHGVLEPLLRGRGIEVKVTVFTLRALSQVTGSSRESIKRGTGSSTEFINRCNADLQ